jgi:hypothetical protein|tara:strand:+ start:1436 stop:1687 length:252 start_codon:yes stop_codon:yes gene_type:complete
MYIEVEEVVTSGLGAGKKRTISVNDSKILTFFPSDTGKGCVLELKNQRIQVTDSYEDVKAKLNNFTGVQLLQEQLTDKTDYSK